MRGEGCIHFDEGPLPFWSSFSALFCSRPCPGAFFTRTGVSLEVFFIFVRVACSLLRFFSFLGGPSPPQRAKNHQIRCTVDKKQGFANFSKTCFQDPLWLPLGSFWASFGSFLGSLGSLWWPLGPQGRPKVDKKRIKNAS